MFAGLDGGFEHHRAEAGRGGEKDDIGLLDGFLISFQSDEFILIGHIDLGAELGLEGGEAGLEAVGEGIGHGNEAGASAGQRLAGSASPASTAADESQLQFIAAGNLGAGGNGKIDRSGGDGGAADELPAVGGGFCRRGFGGLHGGVLGCVGNKIGGWRQACGKSPQSSIGFSGFCHFFGSWLAEISSSVGVRETIPPAGSSALAIQAIALRTVRRN